MPKIELYSHVQILTDRQCGTAGDTRSYKGRIGWVTAGVNSNLQTAYRVTLAGLPHESCGRYTETFFAPELKTVTARDLYASIEDR